MSGCLYLVGTPIGNLNDISKRAIDTLCSVDFIAAEDTRVTLKLLNHLGIKKKMVSYFEHNKKEKGEIICQEILNGKSCALVSDAGMPCIADPGEDLVKLCYEKNIKVSVIPGPSALVSALSVSGLSTSRFTFEGFLSTTKKRRIDHLKSLETEPRTIIFYEAPHKTLKTLNDLLKYLGNRKISIVREITKIYEEIIRTTLQDAINLYNQKDLILKGEIVIIIEGYKNNDIKKYSLDDAVIIATDEIKKGTNIKDASKISAKITSIKKSDIYKAVLNNKNRTNL